MLLSLLSSCVEPTLSVHLSAEMRGGCLLGRVLMGENEWWWLMLIMIHVCVRACPVTQSNREEILRQTLLEVHE